MVLGEFEMGTAANPIADAVKARLTIRNVAINTTTDPGSWGNGLIVLGKIRVHGAVKDVSDNRLAIEPASRRHHSDLRAQPSPAGKPATSSICPARGNSPSDENLAGVPLDGRICHDCQR